MRGLVFLRLVMKRFFLSILLAVVTLCASARSKQFILCIDPGHGGHDAGAVGIKAKEKDINLAVSLAFGKLVEQKCKDVKVVYTRTTDVFITLQGRADIANAAKADLFISVHTNSVPDGHWAYGSETFALGQTTLGTNYSVVTSQGRLTVHRNGREYQEAYNGGSSENIIGFEMLHAEGMEQGALLAQCIQRWYAKAGRVDKGVKPGVWMVLRRTVMPAVLTELGFVSTPDEEEYLTSNGGVQTLARCLYNGFIDYRNALDHQRRKTLDLNAAPSPRPRPNPQQQTSPLPQTPTPTPTQPQAQHQAQQSDQPARAQQHPQRQSQQTQPARPQQQPQRQQQQPSRQNQQPQRQQSNAPKPKVCFKVQILSSSKELKLDDPQFKGLKDISFYREGNTYKYTSGSFDTLAAARKHKEKIAADFSGAFVIAFVDGKRVSIQEAQEALKK